MKYIHISDVHLCRSFVSAGFSGEKAKEQRERLWQSFRGIIEKAKNEKIELLLIGGDLFEENNASVTDIKRISDYFESIKETTKVYISSGNHDPNTPGSYYESFPWAQNVHIFPSFIEEVDLGENVSLYGFSWNRKEYSTIPFEQISLDINRTNILLIHCDLISPSSVYMPISQDDLEQMGFDYCFLGHIHKHLAFDSFAQYSSSLEPLDFSETGEHGYVEGEILGKKVLTSFVPCAQSVFEIKELVLNPSMDSNDIKRAVYNLFASFLHRDAFCRVIFTGMIDKNIDLSHIFEDIKNDFYYLEYIDYSKQDMDIDAIKEANRDNIIGEFIAALSSKEDPVSKIALKEGLSALMESRQKK